MPALFAMLMLGVLSGPAFANHEQSPSIGTLDVDGQETGDGAGCVFHVDEEHEKAYVFVDRDGYGWMRLNEEIKKFIPVQEFVMWPSREGERLSREYEADEVRLKLDVKVVAGCTGLEDHCPARYGGTLSVLTERSNTLLRVEGHCED